MILTLFNNPKIKTSLIIQKVEVVTTFKRFVKPNLGTGTVAKATSSQGPKSTAIAPGRLFNNNNTSSELNNNKSTNEPASKVPVDKRLTAPSPTITTQHKNNTKKEFESTKDKVVSWKSLFNNFQHINTNIITTVSNDNNPNIITSEEKHPVKTSNNTLNQPKLTAKEPLEDFQIKSLCDRIVDISIVYNNLSTNQTRAKTDEMPQITKEDIEVIKKIKNMEQISPKTKEALDGVLNTSLNPLFNNILTSVIHNEISTTKAKKIVAEVSTCSTEVKTFLQHETPFLLNTPEKIETEIAHKTRMSAFLEKNPECSNNDLIAISFLSDVLTTHEKEDIKKLTAPAYRFVAEIAKEQATVKPLKYISVKIIKENFQKGDIRVGNIIREHDPDTLVFGGYDIHYVIVTKDPTDPEHVIIITMLTSFTGGDTFHLFEEQQNFDNTTVNDERKLQMAVTAKTFVTTPEKNFQEVPEATHYIKNHQDPYQISVLNKLFHKLNENTKSLGENPVQEMFDITPAILRSVTISFLNKNIKDLQTQLNLMEKTLNHLNENQKKKAMEEAEKEEKTFIDNRNKNKIISSLDKELQSLYKIRTHLQELYDNKRKEEEKNKQMSLIPKLQAEAEERRRLEIEKKLNRPKSPLEQYLENKIKNKNNDP